MEWFPYHLRASASGEPASRPALPPGPRLVLDTPALPGFICEVCFDAPAVLVRPAPWGGEMGTCAGCGAWKRTPAPDQAPDAEEARHF